MRFNNRIVDIMTEWVATSMKSSRTVWSVKKKNTLQLVKPL